MVLKDYIPIPPGATVAGAPIDAFQANAFRLNDLFFEKVLRSLLCSPPVGSGFEGVVNVPSAKQIHDATTITVNNVVDLERRVPLIWFARESITLKNIINAQGRGAQPTEDGDFGGSGGGGAAVGHECKLPLSGTQMVAGGPIGGTGFILPADWATRALSILALCKGGASGGDATGGAGGGVVVLCAPLITFDRSGASTGEINAKGNPGTAGGGGGGGGLVILIANEITVSDRSAVATHVDVSGGGGAAAVVGPPAVAAGGAGGPGLLLERKFIT